MLSVLIEIEEKKITTKYMVQTSLSSPSLFHSQSNFFWEEKKKEISRMKRDKKEREFLY